MSDYPEYPDEAVIREWVAHVVAKYEWAAVTAAVQNKANGEDPGLDLIGILAEAQMGPDGHEDDALIHWSSGWLPGAEPAFTGEYGEWDGFHFHLFPTPALGEWAAHLSTWSLGWLDELDDEECIGAELVVRFLSRLAIPNWQHMHEFAKRLLVMPTLARSA